MKNTQEIYMVRFNKLVTKDDIHFTTYTVGVPTLAALSLLTPISIVLKEDKIIVTFTDKSQHIFHYNEDCELFIRDKEKPKTEK